METLTVLRDVIRMEKPDAILHFTDPRFWIWLYNMEHEIRQDIPIMYYNIWDDIPDPLYNTNLLQKFRYINEYIKTNLWY